MCIYIRLILSLFYLVSDTQGRTQIKLFKIWPKKKKNYKKFWICLKILSISQSAMTTGYLRFIHKKKKTGILTNVMHFQKQDTKMTSFWN